MKTKISRIGKKSLSVIIALMMIVSTMLVGMVTTNAATTYFTNGSTIYFNSGNSSSWWDSSAATYIKFVQDGTNNFSWVNMTKNSDGYYYGNVPSSGSYDKLLFVRASSSLNTSNTWDNNNIYNNTSNFSVNDVGTNNCYTLTSNDGSSISGKWSNYSGGSSTVTKYYYSYYDGSNNQYKEMTNNNGVYTFEPSSLQLGNTNGVAKFKITTSSDTSKDPANSEELCVNKNNPEVTRSTAMETAGITVQLNNDQYNDVQISNKTKEYVITFTPNSSNPLTGTINVDLKSSTPTPTTTYYLGGRITGDNNGTWITQGETTYPFEATETAGVYKYVSNQTPAVWSENRGGNPQYFYVLTGENKPWYGTSDTTVKLSSSGQSVDLKRKSYETKTEVNYLTYIDSTDKTGNVVFYLDTNNGMKLYYEVEGGSTTKGAFEIKDKTAVNGSLSFSAEGKTAGTADAGNTVNVKAKPYAGFTCSGITVTYTDTTTKAKVTIPATGSGNSYEFIVPSDLTTTVVKNKEISVAATFTLDKAAYIASQGDGLWIDVAPDKNDTTATLIKWNNYKGKDQGTDNPYTFYVPKNVDLTNAKVYNGFDTNVVLNNVTIPANSCNTATLSIPASNTNYTTSGGTTSPVKVMQGSTDAMFLHTTKEDGTDFDLPTKRNWPTDKGVTDKQASEYKATIESSGGSCTTMDNTSGTANFSSAMGLDTVKGRGNSSWKASATMFGKYAFNMKLKSKTNLLGMDSTESEGAKSWCLLANNADESMLRNALTYQLASEIGLLYSPEFRFVDIYDNGEYMGSYLVTEKVDVGSSKLVKGISYDDINEDYAKESGLTEVNETTSKGTYNNNSTDNMQYAKVTVDGVTTNVPCDNTVADAKLKGKYLLEFEITDRYTDETSWFISPRGQHVVVKSPEFATKEQVTYIAQKFAAMEEIAFTTDATKAQLSTVMDVASFAKMYLIQEFSSNLDAASTSYYLTFDCSQANPVFVANPVWDYDWAYGQYTNTNNVGAKKPVSGNGQDEYLQTSNPEKWVAKYKSMDDSKGGSAYSIQSQLASKNSAFKTEIRKQWEGLNGFYTTIQKYYGTDGQIMTWYNQIKDSVDMNETRWGFIESDPISGWGSTETGDTHADAVNYLNNTWTAARATWLNKQFTSEEYPVYTPSAPTIKAYAADGTTEISAVEAGSPFIIKVTSDLESGVVYRLYKDGVKVGTDQSDGNFDIATDESMVGSTYTYTVKAVYGGRESSDSTGVEITINEKAGKKTVRVYFKSAAASAYVPSFSLDNSAATVMSRTRKTSKDNGTYFGSTYSGSLKFYWFFKDITIDTSVPHTITFTTKSNVNATDSYIFGAATEYYFAVDNLMGDTNLINLTGKDEYIRNYHISATHMVHSTTDDNNVGFTWMKDSDGNYKEYAMGTYLPGNNISTASLTDLTSSSLLTIPSALTPNAMLQASTAPSFFTIKSATLAQRITADISEVSTLQYQLLDVNLDGVVDVKDSTMMQKALANF